jgi:hypothetical protein
VDKRREARQDEVYWAKQNDGEMHKKLAKEEAEERDRRAFNMETKVPLAVHSTVALLLHSCCTLVTLLSHCCHTLVTLLLRSQGAARRPDGRDTAAQAGQTIDAFSSSTCVSTVFTIICFSRIGAGQRDGRGAGGAQTVVLLLLYCCYTVATLLLYCCYTVVTLLLHCCYTVVTLW